MSCCSAWAGPGLANNSVNALFTTKLLLAPSAGCVFSSHVFLAILKCFSSPHQARLTLLNIFLFGCYFVFVKIFCIQILTNISFNIFCTFWYRRANNRQIGFIFCYPGTHDEQNICVWACGDESWAHVSVTCDKWGLMSCTRGVQHCSHCSCSLPPPLVCTDNVKVRARSRPWWRVSDMINGELRSAPATLVWGVRREGIAGRGLPTLVGLTGYYQASRVWRVCPLSVKRTHEFNRCMYVQWVNHCG